MTVTLLRRTGAGAPYTVVTSAQPGDPSLSPTDTGDYLSIDDSREPALVTTFQIAATDDALARAAAACQRYREARGYPPADAMALARWLRAVMPGLMGLPPQPVT